MTRSIHDQLPQHIGLRVLPVNLLESRGARLRDMMKARALHSVESILAEGTDTQCMEAAQVRLVVFSEAQQIHISKMYT